MKSLNVIAAATLLVVMSAPVHGLTLKNGTTLDATFHDRLSGPNFHDLDLELTKIFSREDKDTCPRKCTTKNSEGGSGGGGGGLGRSGSLVSEQSLAAALLGGGSGGGGPDRHSSDASDSNNDLNSGAALQDPSDGTSVSATPLPAALPLFATGLGAIGLLGWCRKRKALRKAAARAAAGTF